jgi:hypothetical protein
VLARLLKSDLRITSGGSSVIDAILCLARMVDTGLVTPEHLVAAFRQAAAQQGAQAALVDLKVRGTPVAVLANTFAARVKPAPQRPQLVVDKGASADSIASAPLNAEAPPSL